ncbi:hypothetical protein BJY01DRAFT_252946 [Aspergillus pseudoustus]|uniref:Uncharacterized protein n=1 Tax=Aspergillus pseudoustus TaxID=1810923 RepID=A0ABR4J3P5_9EURO
MEQVRKPFFNPLAKSKCQIQEILQGLPVGSAHLFSPERLLLCWTANGITEIDIPLHPEDYFFNAVDLGELGETLLRRMAGFQSHLGVFEDFQIMQAPAPTFKIPIVSGQITIFAVSEKMHTYYDFCFADVLCNTCCFNATDTFEGISHSGDINHGRDFLAHVRLDQEALTEEKICDFISGYQYTRITRFLGTNPALLVADHVDKILYIIPVPLDAATIGDARAQTRADPSDSAHNASASTSSEGFTQTIRFGTGIEFQLLDEGPAAKPTSAVILPCIFGAQLQGPILLATGTIPLNVQFVDEFALRSYYRQLKSAVVIVDERMTDNARNLATAYRINALFILQLNPQYPPTNTEEVLQLLNAANINAVTGLAGPQSLLLIQVGDRYYFYRGIANQAHLNTCRLEFGADVTSILESAGVESMLDPRIERIVTLGETNSILLPSSGQRVQVQDLEKPFKDLSMELLNHLEDDISASVKTEKSRYSVPVFGSTTAS